MPQQEVYQVEIGDDTFEVEADSFEAAVAAAKKFNRPTREIRPYTPGLVERGLNTLSDIGGIPAMVSGVARDVVSPVENLLHATLGPTARTTPSVPLEKPIVNLAKNLEEVTNRVIGNVRPAETQDERFGSNLAALMSVSLGNPSMMRSVPERGASVFGRLADAMESEAAQLALPSSGGGITKRGMLGRIRPRLAATLRKFSVEDVTPEVLARRMGGDAPEIAQMQTVRQALGSVPQIPEAESLASTIRLANTGGLAPDVAGGMTQGAGAPRLTKDPMKALAREVRRATSGTGSRLRELSSKAVLTPEEAQELAFLNRLAATQASETGMSYAARGRGR